MRKLSAALAALTLVVTLSGPAWAAGTEPRHHRYSGQADSPDGADRSGDRTQHDDPSILF